MHDGINTNIIKYVSIFGSILFIVSIIMLIRGKKLKEEYSLLWLFFGFIFLALSIWRPMVDHISRFLGIAYSPAALFLILIIAILSILIHFSVVLSKMTETTKNLVQEIGLLKLELEKKKKTTDSEDM